MAVDVGDLDPRHYQSQPRHCHFLPLSQPRASQIEKFQSRLIFSIEKRAYPKFNREFIVFNRVIFNRFFNRICFKIQSNFQSNFQSEIQSKKRAFTWVFLSYPAYMYFVSFCFLGPSTPCVFFCFLGLASPHGHLLSLLSFNTLAVFPVAFPKICRKRLSSLDSSQKRLSSLISSACRHLAILTFHPPQPFSTNCQRFVGPPYALKIFFRQGQNQGIEFLGQEFF